MPRLAPALTLALALALALAAPASGLRPRPRGATTRRQLLERGVAAASGLGLAAASALAPTVAAASVRKYSAADAQEAAGKIREARRMLDGVDALVDRGSFEDVQALLGTAPISTFEVDCTVLVQAPVLDAEDKKSIGTIKRYGVGADVIIMLGGLNEAAGNEDAALARSYAAKARASLDEILVIIKSNRL